MNETVYPRPWWFRLALLLFPDRCREIPEAKETQTQAEPRILLRQFAIIKQYCYLQQFASGEDEEFFHSHPWSRGTLALGLWGAVTDTVPMGAWRTKRVKAPYLRFMGPNHVHQTTEPSPGHTSIFIGLGRKTDDKFYFKAQPGIPWREHIKKLVSRI